jgi:nucleotide-binding universal stress UspA family protein
MSRRRIAVLLEISEISTEILPVVRRLFPADQAELTLIAVAQRNLSPMVTEAYLTGMPPSLYASPIYTEDEWEMHLRVLQESLHRIAQNLRTAGYSVQTVLLKGEKVQAIAEYVENRPFDLIAMATYGRKGLSRLVYGSVAERLLRMVSAPMLLFRPQPVTEGAPLAAERAPAPAVPTPTFTIVAATDGGPHTMDAVQVAARVARALDADYRILVAGEERQGAATNQQTMRTVAELVRGFEPQPALVPLVGPPEETIARYLETQPADLLVVGAFHDRGSGGPAALGRTAQRVIEGAPKSVLVVKDNVNLARMLVCVTDHSTPLLDDALQFAQALEAKVDVVFVAGPSEAGQTHWLDTAADDFAATLEADRALAGAWQRIQSRLNDRGVAAEKLHLGYGEPVSAILQLAQERAYDLLVTGGPGPGQAYADSFVDKLVRRAPHSVLVIRA